MKKLTRLSAVLCLAIVSQACSDNMNVGNDLATVKLRGKVHTYSEVSYQAVQNGEEVTKGARTQAIGGENDVEKTYNMQGNQTEEKQFDENGNLISRVVYDYDQAGKKTSMTHYNALDSLVAKSSYKYDEKGNQVEINWHNADGNVSSKTTFAYDEKGNKTEETTFESVEGFNSETKCSYKYDKKGNKIEENNEENDCVDDKEGLTFSSTNGYKYDRHGNQTEIEKYNAEGKLETRIVFRYDKKGNNIERSHLNAEGKVKQRWIHKYEYDKAGNWVRRIGYKDSTPKFVTERNYKYY